ncbi:hypothetical protein BGX23_001851, partial [Mortierella sp. AD031]
MEFFKAAYQGNANAQHIVGVMYQEAMGVPRSYSKAMEWYLKAANQGFAAAQHKLGFMYDVGKGVPQDYSKAM